MEKEKIKTINTMDRQEWIAFKVNAMREGKSANRKLIELVEDYNERENAK